MRAICRNFFFYDVFVFVCTLIFNSEESERFPKGCTNLANFSRGVQKNMKIKKIIKSASRGSKRVRGISREVRVLDLQAPYGISNNALSTLMVLVNPHKYAHLFYKVCNCLRGFDPRMQGEIVEALALYYTGEAFTITCIEHIDELLVNLYRECDRLLAE